MASSKYSHLWQSANIIFTETEFDSAQCKTLLPILCDGCGKVYYRTKLQIIQQVSRGNKLHFCSKQCLKQYRTKDRTGSYTCLLCGKQFTNLPSKYASGDFCSSACAKKYSSAFANTPEKRLEKSNTMQAKYPQKVKKEKKPAKRKVSNVTKSSRKRSSYSDDDFIALYEEYNFCDISSKLNVGYNIVKQRFMKLGMVPNPKFIPANYFGTIRFCKTVLNKNTSITYDDLYQVRDIIEDMLFVQNMSVKEVQHIFKTRHKCFTTFLKSSLKVATRNASESQILHHAKRGTYTNKTEKEIYKMRAEFSFPREELSKVKGNELLSVYGMYHPIDNPNGVARDHMVSREYGWENNIPTEVISHPANCEFIPQPLNSSKGAKCSITIEELYQRIENWNNE